MEADEIISFAQQSNGTVLAAGAALGGGQARAKRPSGSKAAKAQASREDGRTIDAYIGAELYSNRMYPFGCPSFQKAQVKLMRAADGKVASGEKYKLVDSAYFTNKDGFGFMLKQLTKGNY